MAPPLVHNAENRDLLHFQSIPTAHGDPTTVDREDLCFRCHFNAGLRLQMLVKHEPFPSLPARRDILADPDLATCASEQMRESWKGFRHRGRFNGSALEFDGTCRSLRADPFCEPLPSILGSSNK